MLTENNDPILACDFDALNRAGIHSRADLVLLTRVCSLDAPLADALNTMMDFSQGPEVAEVHFVRDAVEMWRKAGPISHEWAVFVLLDLALQYARGAPTLSEAAFPFMTAVARVAADIEHDAASRLDDWGPAYAGGISPPEGPASERLPSSIRRGLLRSRKRQLREFAGAPGAAASTAPAGGDDN